MTTRIDCSVVVLFKHRSETVIDSLMSSFSSRRIRASHIIIAGIPPIPCAHSATGRTLRQAHQRVVERVSTGVIIMCSNGA